MKLIHRLHRCGILVRANISLVIVINTHTRLVISFVLMQKHQTFYHCQGPLFNKTSKTEKKSLCFFSSTPLGRGCNISYNYIILHPWSNGVLEKQMIFAVLDVSLNMGITVIKILRFFVLIFAVVLPDFIYFCTTVAQSHPSFIKIVVVFDLYTP